MDQIKRLDSLDQFVAKWNQHRRVARRVLQLRFGKFEFPIAQSLAFVDGFVEITGRNRFQAVALFDVTSGNQLAGEECVEQSSKIDAKVVLDEFGIELRVVGDLDWTRRGEQLT